MFRAEEVVGWWLPLGSERGRAIQRAPDGKERGMTQRPGLVESWRDGRCAGGRSRGKERETYAIQQVSKHEAVQESGGKRRVVGEAGVELVVGNDSRGSASQWRGERERANGGKAQRGVCTLRETDSGGCTAGLGGPRSRWQSYKERRM